MTAVAKHIRALRTERNLTQEDLAEKLHVTRQTVSNWETGKSQPDVETLEKIAGALETDVMTLIYGVRGDEKVHRLHRRWMGVCAVLCCIFLGLFVTYVALEKNGVLGTWNGGIAYQFMNTDYALAYSEVDGSYSVDLDLNDLENNRGKVLYQKNGCCITVDFVDESIPGNYRVFFRADGKVDAAGSCLVSGMQDVLLSSGGRSISRSAAACVKVGEHIYPCTYAGGTGLEKNGNSFGFWIKTDLYGDETGLMEELLRAEDGHVTLSVSQLTQMETRRIRYWGRY